jgi:hypothetical protein
MNSQVENGDKIRSLIDQKKEKPAEVEIWRKFKKCHFKNEMREIHMGEIKNGESCQKKFLRQIALSY